MAGIVLAAAALAWFVFQIMEDSDTAQMPFFWASALVPHLGPLLMLLVLVKSFRPKGPRDCRILQGIALAEVCLACVLGVGPILGVLLLAYVTAALWGLALLHLNDQVGNATNGTAAVTPTSTTGVPIPWRFSGWGRVLRWTLAIVVLVPVLFLCTPRLGNGEWNPLYLMFTKSLRTNQHHATGASEEIDLNASGAIEVDDEIVMTVFASKDPEGKVPKTDLSDEQRLARCGPGSLYPGTLAKPQRTTPAGWHPSAGRVTPNAG